MHPLTLVSNLCFDNFNNLTPLHLQTPGSFASHTIYNNGLHIPQWALGYLPCFCPHSHKLQRFGAAQLGAKVSAERVRAFPLGLQRM